MASENNETEGAVSMVDVLEEEEKLEQDASAVLGGSDHSNCTYDLGYISRQAIYACATCTKPDKDTGGICLACSLDCHDGHDLIELYTKRNFRCDCGNSRLPDITCKFVSSKSPSNDDNKYNQNFRGVYCICSRPYPDPDDEIEDEMIQCMICEDWYHGRHIGSKVPENDNFDEMICDNCMEQNSFLRFYTVHSLENVSLKKEVQESDRVEVVSSHESENEAKKEDPKNSEPSSTNDQASNTNSSPKSPESCLLEELKKTKPSRMTGGTFWASGWRDKLCRCHNCMDIYTKNDVLFLLDENDPVHVYEAKGKEKNKSSHDQGMEALSNMGRLQQVEVLHEYNDLKTELKDYLQKFADNRKVVREEDIKEFFGQMSARKRQKTSAGFQYNCK